MNGKPRENAKYVVGNTGTIHIVRLPHANPLMARPICGTRPRVQGWDETFPADDKDLCFRCEVGYRLGWNAAPLPGEASS